MQGRPWWLDSSSLPRVTFYKHTDSDILVLKFWTFQTHFIGWEVWYAGAICTFMRFIPALKPYDYGLMIFILTFSMVSVSSYGPEDFGIVVRDRILSIIIGSVIAIVVCICICPVWNGEDLQNLIAKNIEKLGNFLEGILLK